MRLLGIRLDDHDASFCLYDNGIFKYLKTERVYQTKHHAYNNASDWIADLKTYFDLSPYDLDEIAIVADPLRYGVNQFFDFTDKPYNELTGSLCPVVHVEHHLAHALSACMEDDTDYQIVVDGVGELFLHDKKAQGTVWSVFNNYKLVERNTPEFEIINKDAMRIKNSFGVEYENLARHLNVEAGHPEDLPGKLMSLQSFGKVNYNFIEYLTSRLTDIKTELSIACHPHNWEDFIGSEQVANLSKLDFAASIHYFMEQCLLNLIRKHAKTNDRILISGGCAQNICWNTTIKNEFPNTVIVPHSADDGLSIGAVEFLRRKHNLPKGHFIDFPFVQSDHAPLDTPTQETINTVAQMLADGKIVGWYQGNGEIGPRALGNRSILMNPCIDSAKEVINNKVKHREAFRPFGATILKEYQNQYFDVDFDNPFMLYLGKVKKHLPAITHIDGTCRFQTLGNENKVYRQLLEAFYKITGLPLLLNTSLNQGGKPIAGSKRDALGVLYDTQLDVLVYGNEIITKE